MIEKINFEKQKRPDEPEINEGDLPLQEIVPDENSEKKKYEINIINSILNDIKDGEKDKEEDNPTTVH